MRSIRSIIFQRLFVIVLMFFGVVTAVSYYLTSEAIRQFAITDATTSLSFVINNIRSNFLVELKALDQLVLMDGFRPFDRKSANETGKKFLQFQNVFSTVHMYAINGDLIFAEKRKSVPEYVIESNFFRKKDPSYIVLAKKVIEEKRAAASETYFTSTGDLYQTYIVPVLGETTEIIGIVSGGVFPRLQKIDHLLEGLKLGKSNFILITDSNGRLIASDGIKSEQIASIKQHTEMAAAKFFHSDTDLGKNSAADSNALVNENIRLASSCPILISLPIPELKLIVTLGVNTMHIEKKKEELSNRLLVSLFVGLLLTLFASVFIGERLARPFREIAEVVNQVNNGNFAARVDYDYDDEIGYLAGLVNKISQKIEKSEYLGNLWQHESEIASSASDNKESADS